MATTAVVNPRRRRRAKHRRSNPRRRRRNYYGAARRRRRNPSPYAMVNPRRRRGRRRDRRTNPSPYAMVNPRRRRSSGGRRRNPMGGFLDFDRAMEIGPPATLGVLMARWLVKFAGPFENPGATTPGAAAEPGIKHALALLIGSKVGADIIDSFMPGKGHYAEISALGWAGDFFLRKRFMRESFATAGAWAHENLYLDGFEMESQIGQSEFVDATGQRFIMTPQGWALAGMGEGQMMVMPNGDVVELSGQYGDGGGSMGGFEMRSQIGDGDDDDDDDMGGEYETGINSMGGSSFGGW